MSIVYSLSLHIHSLLQHMHSAIIVIHSSYNNYNSNGADRTNLLVYYWIEMQSQTGRQERLI